MQSFIQSLMSLVMHCIRSLLSVLIPVKKGKIIFESFPDYSDNARAFSDYLLQHTDYRLIWSVCNPLNYKSNNRILFIKKDGGNKLKDKLVYAYHTLSAQYLISTHGSFRIACRREQTYVCCWHGMPLKRIAQWKNADDKDYLNNAKFILSTSTYYKPLLGRCFGKPEDAILATGYPRNDWLFHESDVLDKLQIKKTVGEKLIMYLPTFRKPESGGYLDSDVDSFNNGLIDLTTEKSLLTLNDYLKHLNIVLIVKPHPSESNQLFVKRLSNLKIFPHKYFLDNDIQLNKVLHYIDALITDFSGAFIDYLNLNRPIGFVLSDVDNYNKNRGFVFDNPLEFMPGMKIFNEQDFKSFCDDVANGRDLFINERESIRTVYNDFADDNNCQRLFEFLKL